MRKETTITISAEGRDKGKKFLLREMAAAQAEAWAVRAFLAMARNGVKVPDDVAKLGLGALAQLGFGALSGINYEELKPLMDEMFKCVQIVEPHVTRDPTDDDIEEIATRFHLRKEVFDLHVGFLRGAGLSTLSPPTPISPPPIMPMSPTPSARPSRPAARR